MIITSKLQPFSISSYVTVFIFFLLSAPDTRANDVELSPGLISGLLFVANDLPGVNKPTYLSPTALTVSPNGATLYVAQHTGRRIDFVNSSTNAVVKSVHLPKEPTGMVLSANGELLYVTCASDLRPWGIVCVIKTSNGSIDRIFSAGHYPLSPALSPDGATLYLCNRFSNNVEFIDAQTGVKLAEIPMLKEPYSLAPTPDGKTLVVANNLAVGPSTLQTVTCGVSIINVKQKAVTSHIFLSNGSHTTAGLCISADGKYAFVAHVLGRFNIPTNTITQGWIYSNEISIIDINAQKLVNTIIIDDNVRGMANPWGVAISPDSKNLCIAISGTNELCVIDVPKLFDSLTSRRNIGGYEPDHDFTFLQGIKRRVALRGDGARAVTVFGSKAYVGHYFSDSVSIVDLSQSPPVVTYFGFGSSGTVPPHRRGEMLFYSAKHCFQNWQSCHSCHPDGRTNALNWDLANDEFGNPKDVKSLLFAQLTPPSMAHGIRDDYRTAIRAGFSFILFTEPVEASALAIEQYVNHLRPLASPFLQKGMLSEAAKRGKKIFFESPKTDCYTCHPPPLYTDLQTHDVGTRTPFDKSNLFDTPSLRECWRTAPYLHDGRYISLNELFKIGKHGLFVNLTDQEIEDLVEFLKTL